MYRSISTVKLVVGSVLLSVLLVFATSAFAVTSLLPAPVRFEGTFNLDYRINQEFPCSFHVFTISPGTSRFERIPGRQPAEYMLTLFGQVQVVGCESSVIQNFFEQMTVDVSGDVITIIKSEPEFPWANWTITANDSPIENSTVITGTLSGSVILTEGIVYVETGNILLTNSCREENLTDTDEDGIPDVWEVKGVDVDCDGFPEIDLPALGARVGVRDIFVEIDYLPTRQPSQKTLQDVTAAFQAQGIAVHFELDQEIRGLSATHDLLFSTAGPGPNDDFSDVKLTIPDTATCPGYFGIRAEKDNVFQWGNFCDRILDAHGHIF